MIGTARDGGNASECDAIDFDSSAICSCSDWRTRGVGSKTLTVGVVTPSNHIATAVQSDGVISTAGDSGYVESGCSWNGALAVKVVAPSKNRASFKRGAVAVTAGDSGYAGSGCSWNGALTVAVRSESKNTTIF